MPALVPRPSFILIFQIIFTIIFYRINYIIFFIFFANTICNLVSANMIAYIFLEIFGTNESRN